MPTLAVQTNFSTFTDVNGKPLDNGYIWVGVVNLDPQTNPVATYWDEALTIPAPQPFRTLNGYIVRAGTPARVYIGDANFSLLVQDSRGMMVYTFPAAADPNTTALSADIAAVVTNLAASGGSALVGFIQAGTGAVLRTLQSKARDIVSVQDFGVVGDGTTNDALKIQAAIATLSAGNGLFFPPGTYLITSMLSTPDGVPITLFGCGKSSVIKKGFNGDMLSLGSTSEMHHLYLDGNGATFTGRGVVISTGAVNNVSWRRIVDCDIYNTASYAVDYTAAIAGYGSTIINSRMVPQTSSVAAVHYPTAAESNGNRSIVACWSASNPLVDFAGSNDSTTVANNGGTPIFSADTKKAVICGNRFPATGLGATINGIQHSITGNVWAEASMTFAAGFIGGQFRGNYTIATITDNTVNSTSNATAIDIEQQFYTPVWTATTTNPVIGNGSIGGAWQRRGTYARVNIIMTAGSTTTFGAGYFQFRLPYTSQRNATGTCYIETNFGGLKVYGGTVYVIAGTNVAICVIGGSSASYVGAAFPVAFQTNDKILIDIDYAI